MTYCGAFVTGEQTASWPDAVPGQREAKDRFSVSMRASDTAMESGEVAALRRKQVAHSPNVLSDPASIAGVQRMLEWFSQSVVSEIQRKCGL